MQIWTHVMRFQPQILPIDVATALAAIEAEDAHRRQRSGQPPRYFTRQEIADWLMRSFDVSHAQVGTPPAVKGIHMTAQSLWYT